MDVVNVIPLGTEQMNKESAQMASIIEIIRITGLQK
jgi:hypothetical protein